MTKFFNDELLSQNYNLKTSIIIKPWELSRTIYAITKNYYAISIRKWSNLKE